MVWKSDALLRPLREVVAHLQYRLVEIGMIAMAASFGAGYVPDDKVDFVCQGTIQH